MNLISKFKTFHTVFIRNKLMIFIIISFNFILRNIFFYNTKERIFMSTDFK